MRHHPDDVKAVRATNLPRLMAIAKAIQIVAAPVLARKDQK